MNGQRSNFSVKNYAEKKNILLRSYQIKLIEKAKIQNSIIFLPTGAGKTLIALNVLSSRSEDLKGSFSQGGKRAFFVAPTKVMVFQLATVLLTHTKFNIGHYTGDMNVDAWSKSTWLSEMEKYQVLVLTAEILRRILALKFISPLRISLIVFDECHHAVLNHPYKGVMKALEDFSVSEIPLILGLTSTLLNSTPKKQVADYLEKLENTYKAKILTESEISKVMRHVANPAVITISYDSLPSANLCAAFAVFEEIINKFDTFFTSTAPSAVNTMHEAMEEKKSFSANGIKKCLANAFLHLKELGAFGGAVAALYYIIVLEKRRITSKDSIETQALICGCTQLNKIRRILAKIMSNEETSLQIYNHSSPKLRKLIDIIVEKHHMSRDSDSTSTLVFVRRRATAVVLSFIMKRLKVLDERFAFVNPEFVVSSSLSSDNFCTLHCKNEEIVKQFAVRDLNLLFATNILEEGIDISSCNTVISFDFPNSFSSYIQSRGRGRDPTSIYYVFHSSEEHDKKELLNGYQDIEKQLFGIVCKGVERDESLGTVASIAVEKEETLLISNESDSTIQIDGSMAIQCVHRYCSNLPQDRFACLRPTVWYEVDKMHRIAFLQLPMTSSFLETIKGDPRQNIKLAKKSVFLKTAEILYKMKEIDATLNSRRLDIEHRDFKELFPHFRKIEISKNSPLPGTRKRKQIYKVKVAEWLTNCMPLPESTTYLHVIKFSIRFDKPELDRKATLYNLLKSPYTYGLLTAKKLPNICQFPLFLDMGQIDCDLLVNFGEIVFDSTEIDDIKTFHYALFKKVLNISIASQVFNGEAKENSYLVVPLRHFGETFILNWEIIRSDFCKRNPYSVVPYNSSSENVRNQEGSKKETTLIENMNVCRKLVPAKFFGGQSAWENQENIGEKMNFILTEATYSNFVISPNYRSGNVPDYYVVSSFCHGMSPLSPFPRAEYEDFFTYYKSKYDICIRNLEQPLLKVSNLPHCSNFNRPRYHEKDTNRKRCRAREHEELLVPELCYVYPFFNTYWMKGVLVPTVLNRISILYRTEELRRLIAETTNLDAVEPTGMEEEGSLWKPLEVASWTNREDALEERGEPKSKLDLPLSNLKKENRFENVDVKLDPERNLYEIGLCDLENYIEQFKMRDEEEEYHEITMLKNQTEKAEAMLRKKVQVPALKIFWTHFVSCGHGTELASLVQACTSKSAHDIIDYEKLEILGDSFLKFAASYFLFKRYFMANEGILSAVKGKLVGNRNLLDCGLAKNLPAYINVNDFSPMFDWNPPLFGIPEPFSTEILSKNLDPAVVLKFEIPEEEQFSGNLSEGTLEKNMKILRDEGMALAEPLSNAILGRDLISDKTISDVVEALIGLYVSDFGLRGGFEILNWFDILPREKGCFNEVMEKRFTFQLLNETTDQDVCFLLKEAFAEDLEDSLEYKFENRGLLLEALTHPSYSKNRATLCYQRLEFLGDSLLDFLITSYLCEKFENLNPGEITDIRSALTNNITFACFCVRYQFHKYLLSTSSSLMKAVETFVKLQARKNNEIEDNVLIHLEEENCLLGESVTVPKALGDVFEALAAAIFLDSGNSLETVWRVFYKLMEPEIDGFARTPPKTAVRLLHEICGEKPYFESMSSADAVTVKCIVVYKGHEITSHGFGSNKREAKISASRVALKKIMDLQ